MSKEAIIPISKNYVNYWSVGAGLREFRANARDGACPENAYGHEYDEESQTLCIWNRAKEKLKTTMLVLGHSSKSNGDNSIGHFGEGAKVGFCVLARAGIEIECINMNERWLIEFKYNKGYDAEIMHVTITDCEPTDEIKFIFKNVTPEHVKQFERYLIEKHIESLEKMREGVPLEKTMTSVGEVYLDAPAATFVGGIRIEDADIGYLVNINPSEVELGRDRDTIRWQKATDIAKTITAETMTKERAKTVSKSSRSTTLSRMLAVLGAYETQENVYEGEPVERYKEILKILVEDDVARFNALGDGILIVNDSSDKERAEHLGLSVAVFDYYTRQAMQILGYDLSKKLWNQKEYTPSVLMERVKNKLNAYAANKTTENFELLEASLRLAIISSKNWQQW